MAVEKKVFKDFIELLKYKREFPEISKISEKQEESETLTIEEIDEILTNAWELSSSLTDYAKKENERALEASFKIEYQKGIAKAIRNRAYLYMINSEYGKCIEDANNCLGLINDDNDKLAGTAWDIKALGYNGLGLYDKSVDSTYKSLVFFEKCRYERGIAWGFHNLGMVFSNIGDFDRSEKEYKKSLKKFYEINYADGITRVSTFLSQVARKKKDYTAARKYLEEVEGYIKKDEASLLSFSFYLNRAITKRLEGNLDDAEYDFKLSFTIISQLNNVELFAQYEYEKGLLELEKGELKISEELLLNSLDKATDIGSLLMKKDITHALSQVYEGMKKPEEALKYYKEHNHLAGDLLNNESLQRINNLELHKDIELAEKSREYHQKLQIETEKLLKNVLPDAIVEELKAKGTVKPRWIESATAIFTDFVGFTALSSRVSPEVIVSELDYCFSGFDKIMEDLGIEKLKTIGDGYMAVAGSLKSMVNHADLCTEAGIRIREFMAEYKEDRKMQNKEYWDVRIGIHSGPLIAGVIGNKKFAYDVWGDTVNTASRIESGGNVGEVNISHETFLLVKDRFNCIPTGEIDAKGKGKLLIYNVKSVK